MSSLTIPQVRQWRPGALDTASAAVGKASTAVDEQAKAVGRSLEEALTQAGGAWADAARDRAADEAKIGAQLADALDTARQALSHGATDIGHARTKLLDTISGAQSQGFTVSDDGTVTARTLPPVMSSPEQGAAAAAARNSQQQQLNNQAQGLADDISVALGAVATADSTTAKSLSAVEFPQSLDSAVDAYLDRAWQTRDLLGSLGAAGAGAVSLAAMLKKSVGLFGRSKSFLDFLKSSTAPITDYETFLKNINASDDALKAFLNGKANGGFARFLIGAKAAKIAGKVFLPLTVVTGLADAVTGGGYDGARGWATRGFGLAGAGGAATLLLAGSTLGPVGLGIAGVAVLGYGAWSLGNYVYDHWDDITEFGGKALDWTGDRLSDVGDAASAATDWAGDRLSDAGDAAKDVGKSVVHTVSFGLL